MLELRAGTGEAGKRAVQGGGAGAEKEADGRELNHGQQYRILIVRQQNTIQKNSSRVADYHKSN